MVGYRRVGNEKYQKYGKGQRKSLMHGFTCHMANYKCLINFVNSLLYYLLRFGITVTIIMEAGYGM